MSATHAPNFVISSQGFHIESVKSVINLKNLQISGIQTEIISNREISGRTRRAGAVISKQESIVQNGRVGTYEKVTLRAERIFFKEALDRIEAGFQKNYNTGLYIFFECTLYPQKQCRSWKTKLNAIFKWSNKKQLESRMASREKLQDKINAVYTIYSQCEECGQWWYVFFTTSYWEVSIP